MSSPRPGRASAVVIGASMAGLCAARVLADRFDAVTVVDRDALPGGPDWRHQVPQGRHPHLLLVTGARLLEGWFPGIVEELLEAGAVDLDLCADFYWHQGGAPARRPPSALKGPAMSRPLLERTVRRRVESLANVTIRGATAAAGLAADPSAGRVVGVRLEDGSTIAADLVVDASGRQARTLAWLEELGYEPPAMSTVQIDTRYVTRLYRRTETADRDWKAGAVVDHPSAKRVAWAMPLEGDRWFVTFVGLNGETPPSDDDAMLAYARSFPSPIIADLIGSAEALSEPVTHRFPANQRRHVEKLRRFPLGWVVIGDAVSSFDPIYGQGMTSAALQAEALGAELDRAGAIDRAFGRRYFKAAGRAVATPWSIAVGGDFVYEGTTGKKPPGTDLVNRYMDRVTVAAQHDDGIAIRLNEVIAMVRAPQSLLTPAFVLRVLRTARRGPAVEPAALVGG